MLSCVCCPQELFGLRGCDYEDKALSKEFLYTRESCKAAWGPQILGKLVKPTWDRLQTAGKVITDCVLDVKPVIKLRNLLLYLSDCSSDPLRYSGGSK